MSSDHVSSSLSAPENGSGKPMVQDTKWSAVQPGAPDIAAIEKEPSSSKPFAYDDIGNGERFVTQNQQWLRYVPKLKQWFVWWADTLWSAGHRDEVDRLAKSCARSVLNDPSGGDADRAKKVASWAKYSASVRGLTSMVTTASSEAAIVAEPSEFDRDPWVLNVQNGTIDLHTGDLRPHKAGDLITKVIPIDYEPLATFDMWDRFLRDKVPDRGLRDYLQRAAGYSLTGDVSEEKMFFVYGGTSSGKSTFLEAMQAVLGPYATTATFKMFLREQERGRLSSGSISARR